MRPLLPLLLVAACAAQQPDAPGAARSLAVRQARIEVNSEGARPLAAPRRDLGDQIGRLWKEPATPPSAVDAFAAAAAVELEKRGIQTRRGGDSTLPVLRIALRDLDLRNGEAAGSVAFVSARYTLVDAGGEALWETEQERLPVRLGGPDLTESTLARIAAVAVGRALASLSVSAAH